MRKYILPLNETPSLTTCIHYAYPCAIIESKELAKVYIKDYSKGLWNEMNKNTLIVNEDDIITIKEDGDDANAVLWRDCATEDELILKIDYLKHTEQSRFVDVFLFDDNLESEVKLEDKSYGIRWNPFGLFIKKTMYNYDTKIFTYIKIQIRENIVFGYVSKNGEEWSSIDEIDIPKPFWISNLKIGIHFYAGHNYFKVWKYMNFIQLILNLESKWKGIYLDYYFFPRKNVDNSYGCFVNFLDTHYDLIYDALDCFPTFHDYLKWNIRHGYYIEICLDEFYVRDREYYGRYHYDHYNLFYGYDDNKKEYHCMGYGLQNKPVVSTIPYDVFEQDIIQSEKIIRYKFHSNDITPLKFSVKPIILALQEYINSLNSSEKVSNLLSEESVQYGISVLDLLLRTENGKKWLRDDKRISFCLKERSLLMKERLEYLCENQYIEHEDRAELMELCDELVKQASLLMICVLKNKIRHTDDNIIDGKLQDLKEIDRLFSERLLACLLEQQKNDYE